MLPLIREPHWTVWTASSDLDNIRIGTRDFANRHYMILSNHGDESVTVPISVGGIEVTGAEDFFTGQFIGSSVNGVIDIPVGHHNDGYRVVKLIN